MATDFYKRYHSVEQHLFNNIRREMQHRYIVDYVDFCPEDLKLPFEDVERSVTALATQFRGSVHKRGAVNTSWKLRYLVLAGLDLQYFGSESEYQKMAKPKGRVPLSGGFVAMISIQERSFDRKNGTFSFEVRDDLRQQRVYTFRVETWNEREEWISNINTTCSLLRAARLAIGKPDGIFCFSFFRTMADVASAHAEGKPLPLPTSSLRESLLCTCIALTDETLLSSQDLDDVVAVACHRSETEFENLVSAMAEMINTIPPKFTNQVKDIRHTISHAIKKCVPIVSDSLHSFKILDTVIQDLLTAVMPLAEDMIRDVLSLWKKTATVDFDSIGEWGDILECIEESLSNFDDWFKCVEDNLSRVFGLLRAFRAIKAMDECCVPLESHSLSDDRIMCVRSFVVFFVRSIRDLPWRVWVLDVVDILNCGYETHDDASPKEVEKSVERLRHSTYHQLQIFFCYIRNDGLLKASVGPCGVWFAFAEFCDAVEGSMLQSVDVLYSALKEVLLRYPRLHAFEAMGKLRDIARAGLGPLDAIFNTSLTHFTSSIFASLVAERVFPTMFSYIEQKLHHLLGDLLQQLPVELIQIVGKRSVVAAICPRFSEPVVKLRDSVLSSIEIEDEGQTSSCLRTDEAESAFEGF
eukprot:Rmarinus@m.3918